VPTSTDADALGSDAVWACAATEADRSSTAAAHSPSTEHDSSEDATDERLAWPPSLPASPAPPPARALDSLPTALYNAVCQLLGYSGKPGLSWTLMTLSYCLPALVLDLKDLPWWFHMGAYCLALIWILLVTAGRRLSCQVGLGLFVLFPVQLLFRSLTASAEDLAAGLQRTAKTVPSMLLFLVCIGACVGAQPRSCLTTRTKLRASLFFETMRALALSTFAVRVGSANAPLRLLMCDTLYWVGLAAGWWAREVRSNGR